MSKEEEAHDQPPSYTESVASPPPRDVLNASLYSSHLAVHLSSLPSRLRESQHARSTQQAADDLDLVTRIVPHIEDFLTDLTSSPRPPPLAELNLVPASAMSAAWSLSGAAERRREGELVQLVRVAVPLPGSAASKGGGDSKTRRGDSGSSWTGASAYATTTSGLPPERDWNATQFDEWGRWNEDAARGAGDGAADGGASGAWWMGDERMARRLAAYLQPKPPVKVERRAIQAAVVQAKEEKKSSGWGWGKKRVASSSTTPVATTAGSPPLSPAVTGPKSPSLDADDKVRMAVRAEEVTFRRENEFGVWETMTGWAIVVVVTIRR